MEKPFTPAFAGVTTLKEFPTIVIPANAGIQPFDIGSIEIPIKDLSGPVPIKELLAPKIGPNYRYYFRVRYSLEDL